MLHEWHGDQAAFDRYERVARVPVTLLSYGMVPVLLLPLVVTLPSGAATAVNVADAIGWVLFAADYAVRLYLVPGPGHYARTHLFDLAVLGLWLLPIITVPHGARLLRAIGVLRALSFLASAAAHTKEYTEAHVRRVAAHGRHVAQSRR